MKGNCTLLAMDGGGFATITIKTRKELKRKHKLDKNDQPEFFRENNTFTLWKLMQFSISKILREINLMNLYVTSRLDLGV